MLYPQTGTTKGEVLNYYAQVAPVLLPHVADRAVTRIRWPNGTAKPRSSRRTRRPVPRRGCASPRCRRPARAARRARNGDELHFPVIDGLASLTYLVNLASLELHVHQWKVGTNGRPKNPDRLVIDLDPGDGAGLGECAQVALLVRDRLARDEPRLPAR